MKLKSVFLTLGVFIITNSFSQVCFRPGQNYSGGNNLGAITAGDFNNDSNNDLVITNGSNTGFNLYLGTGTDTFMTPPTQFWSLQPQSIITADFNNDNNLDMVFGCGGIQIFYGNGNGQFTHTFFSNSQFSNDLVPADFNNDGFIDIASVYGPPTPTVTVFLNDGSGNIDTPITFLSDPLTMVLSAACAAGEFNGDNYSDLVVTKYEGLRVYYGIGNGSFSAGPALDIPNGNLENIICADFNGDSIDDIAAKSLYMYPGSSDSLYVFLNNGAGQFLPCTSYNSINSEKMKTVDINSDGIIDIVSVRLDKVIIQLGNGNGGFSNPILYFTSYNNKRIAIADFNNDSLLDLALACDSAAPNVKLLFNSTGISNVNVSTGIPLCAGGNDGSASVVVNGNSPPFHYTWLLPGGLIDTNSTITNLSQYNYSLTVGAADGCSIFRNVPIADPPLLTPSGYSLSLNCTGGNIADIFTAVTGGTPPYTYAWNTTPIQTTPNILNQQPGEYIISVTDSHNCVSIDTFNLDLPLHLGAISTFPILANSPYLFLTDDFNGDSLPDIVTINDSSCFSILINNGVGGFSTANILTNANISLSHPAIAFKSADFSHDGKKDLLFATDSLIYIWFGNGLGGFGNVRITTIHNNFKIDQLILANFNSDSNLDLAILDISHEEYQIATGNGTGIFTPSIINYINYKPKIIARVDLHTDGIDDLVISDNFENVYTYQTNLNNFEVQSSIGLAANFIECSLDTFLTSVNPNIYFCSKNEISGAYGNNHGGFGFPEHFPLTYSVKKMIAANINAHANYPDLIGTDGNDLYISKKNGLIGYYIAEKFQVGANISDIITADFDADGTMDIALLLPDSNEVIIINGCNITSISKNDSKNYLKVYPNPSNGLIKLENNFKNKCIIQVINYEGKIVYENKLIEETLNLQFLPSGIYQLHLLEDDRFQTSTIAIFH